MSNAQNTIEGQLSQNVVELLDNLHSEFPEMYNTLLPLLANTEKHQSIEYFMLCLSELYIAFLYSNEQDKTALLEKLTTDLGALFKENNVFKEVALIYVNDIDLKDFDIINTDDNYFVKTKEDIVDFVKNIQ